MTPRVHIEGFGVLGTLLAWELDARGYDWTWSDIDDPHVAWKASTSLVYPSGEPVDQEGYDAWQVWRRLAPFKYGDAEVVPYYFTTAKPPHKGKYSYSLVKDGPWKFAGKPAVAVNVQEFIQQSRESFATRRTDGPAGGSNPEVWVVAHGGGNNPRRTQYVWGWAQRVEIILPPGVHGHAALYHRKGRFEMAYAYPVANTTHDWWAGSSLIVQKGEPRELDVQKHFLTWERRMEEQGVYVQGIIGEPLQGWRPRGDDANDAAWVRWIDGKLVVRPLWHSGVRWAPQVVRAVLEEL